MKISATILKAISDAINEPVIYNNVNSKFLSVWFAEEFLNKFILFYHMLTDDFSKDTFLRLLYKRIFHFLCGENPKKYYFSNDEWDLIEKRASIFLKDNSLPETYLLDIIETYILEGYSYNEKICVKPGDFVLDCGAYTGHTSFYFANKTGENGLVFAFEPSPAIYNILNDNIIQTKKRNIIPIHAAIYKKSGETYFAIRNNPAASSIGTQGIKVPLLNIDTFVSQRSLNKIDFIKMDIEGSENLALSGAKETIKKYNPTLAICLYHRPEDIVTIPFSILEINPNYHFYLKHNSNSFLETVLFAVPGTPLTPPNTEDLGIIKKYWLLAQSLRTNRDKYARELLLKQYASRIEILYPFLGNAIWDKNFNYAYWPLSDNKRLHYEFFFQNNSCEVSIHFESYYANREDIIDKICKLSKIKLYKNNDIKGCCFICRDINNIEKIVSYMQYLIKISLPILFEHQLLSDHLVLNKDIYTFL